MAQYHERRYLWCVTLSLVDMAQETPVDQYKLLASWPLSQDPYAEGAQWRLILSAILMRVEKSFVYFDAVVQSQIQDHYGLPVLFATVAHRINKHLYRLGMSRERTLLIHFNALQHGPAHLRLRSTQLVDPTTCQPVPADTLNAPVTQQALGPATGLTDEALRRLFIRARHEGDLNIDDVVTEVGRRMWAASIP